jgi:hypothetical protein
MASTPTSIFASEVVYIRQDNADIQYIADNGSWTTIINWPVIVNNEQPTISTLEVLFTTNITLTTDSDRHFMCGTNKVQFGSKTLQNGGTRPIIYIDGITKYPGLIQNMNCGSIYVCNLEVHAINGSTLAEGGGWIGQQYYANQTSDNYIVNCFSNGEITPNSGGIVGTNAGGQQGQGGQAGVLFITGCNTTGLISGAGAGGIIGLNAGWEGGIINITQCFSSGNVIGNGAGAICGESAGRGILQNGTVFAINCYSTGAIGFACGGIFGNNAGNVTALACYSNGTIGEQAGGIFGSAAGTGSILAKAMNCYSTGFIDVDAGGIFGFGYTNVSAMNCYTCGSTNNSSPAIGGIYSGSDNNAPPGSSNYAEANAGNSGWNTDNANTVLQNTPSNPSQVGGAWVSLGMNQPYELASMGYSPYSLTNILGTYALTDNASQTINAGDSTITPVLTSYGYAYSILGIDGDTPSNFPTITMNPLDGTISTTTATPSTDYMITLRNQVNPYNITIFFLTVLGLPPPPFPVPTFESGVPECCQPNVCTMNPQETNYNTSVITQKKGGKAVDKSVTDFYAGVATGQRTAHSQPIFKSYYDYMNYLQGKYK